MRGAGSRQAPGASAPGALSPFDVEQAGADLIRYASSEEVRFGTGWSVDDRCGRVGVGELALWIARSGSGKSTTYLNIIRNTPEVPTVVFNMEMTPRRQVEWLTAMTYDLPVDARDLEELLRFGIEDPRFAEVTSNIGALKDIYPNLFFVMPSRPTVDDMRIVLDDIEASTGVRPLRVFIDHLGLMHGCEDYQGYSRTAAGLHSWAMHDHLALHVLQQTGRSGGDAGRNDGHMPITISSGLYTGDADADFLFGLFRPERDPKFKKSRWQFDTEEKYHRVMVEREACRGITMLQVVKNRIFSDLMEEGLELVYDSRTRRLTEIGAF